MWNSAAASNLLLSFPYHVFFFLSSTPATTRLYASDFFIITVAYMLADSHISVMGHYKRKDLEIFSSSHNIERASDVSFASRFCGLFSVYHNPSWFEVVGMGRSQPSFSSSCLSGLSGFTRHQTKQKKLRGAIETRIFTSSSSYYYETPCWL